MVFCKLAQIEQQQQQQQQETALYLKKSTTCRDEGFCFTASGNQQFVCRHEAWMIGNAGVIQGSFQKKKQLSRQETPNSVKTKTMKGRDTTDQS